MVISILGPGTYIGTEMLANNVVSNYTIKTSADSLLWILTRDCSNEYVKLDSQQKQSAKEYDQMMYYWVNTNQLPITPVQETVIELLAQLYDADVYDMDMMIWNPKKKEKNYRILLAGKAVVGREKKKSIEEQEVSLNEFDFDIGGS